MIEDIYIAAKGEGEDEYTGPPARVLNVTVIGGDAHLGVIPVDQVGNRLQQEGRDVVVRARTLLAALQAAITADGDVPGR
jgi:hypothetical protein